MLNTQSNFVQIDRMLATLRTSRAVAPALLRMGARMVARTPSAKTALPVQVTHQRLLSTQTPRHRFGGFALRKPDAYFTMNFTGARWEALNVASKPDMPSSPLLTFLEEGHVTIRVAQAKAGTPAGGKPEYDWDNAVSAHLGLAEVLTLVQNSIGAACNLTTKEIYSVPDAPPNVVAGHASKKLSIEPGTPFTLTLAPVDGGSGPSASIKLPQSEVYLIRNLLGNSLAWLSGWQNILDPDTLTKRQIFTRNAEGSGSAAPQQLAAPAFGQMPAPAAAPRPQWQPRQGGGSSGYTSGTGAGNNYQRSNYQQGGAGGNYQRNNYQQGGAAAGGGGWKSQNQGSGGGYNSGYNKQQ